MASPPPLDPCPGVIAVTPAQDGLLARIRIPGGILSVAQMYACADLATTCGNGILDITSRANLQIRGLSEATAPRFAAGLQAAGLLVSRAHERVRNIVASPLAGIDPEDLLDPRPLVAALDRALISDPVCAALPAKFGFVIDAGGLAVGAHQQDVGLVAHRAATGLRLRLLLAGHDSRLDVPVEEGPHLALTVARAFLRRATSPGVRRMRDLVRSPAGWTAVIADVAATASVEQATTRLPSRPQWHIGLYGVLPQRQPGQWALAPVVPLGRLRAEQARGLADIAATLDGELRLTPWRGVVLAGASDDVRVWAQTSLARMEFSLARGNPLVGMVACAGHGACTAALADVRRDALALARRLAASPIAETASQRLIHWSGCEKRCAMRQTADVLVMATPEGYDLFSAETRVARKLTSEQAVTQAAGLVAGMGVVQ